MLVEGNQDKAQAFQNRFELAGYETDVFHDGVAALGRLMIKRYDLVVLDFLLPSMRGDMVCNFIREMEKDNEFPSVPILMMGDEEYEIDYYKKKGATEVMFNPINEDEALNRIGEILENIKKKNS